MRYWFIFLKGLLTSTMHTIQHTKIRKSMYINDSVKNTDHPYDTKLYLYNHAKQNFR